MQLTINEIAKKAGVGVGTVSRYINNKPHVSKEKANKIQKVIDEFNFVPSAMGVQLRNQSTGTIGLLVSRVTNPFFATLFDNLERQLNKKGYQLIVSQTHDDPNSEKRFLKQLQNQKLDGIILASVENKNLIYQVSKSFQNKIVILNENFVDDDISSVVLDYYAATYHALEYLYEKGYHKIAYATGGDYPSVKHGKTRNQAFEDFSKKRHMLLDDTMIYPNTHTIEDGIEIARKIIAMIPLMRPDCVFTNSDEVAIGMIFELKRHNIKIPNDIAIMGYDDQPMAKYAQVPITTIKQPIESIASACVELLLNGLQKNSKTIAHKHLKLELVVRMST